MHRFAETDFPTILQQGKAMVSFPLWKENWYKSNEVLLFYTWDDATVRPGFRIYSSTTKILHGFKYTIKSIMSQNWIEEVK